MWRTAGRGRGGVPWAGDDDSRRPDDRATDAPPSRFQEEGPLPTPVTVDRCRPVAGLLREVTGSGRDDGNPVRRQMTAMRLLDCEGGSRHYPSFSAGSRIAAAVLCRCRCHSSCHRCQSSCAVTMTTPTRTSAMIQAQWWDNGALRMDTRAGHGGQSRERAPDDGADRGCNNQPLMRAARASSGWR